MPTDYINQRIPKDLYQRLQELAWKKSVEEKRTVTPTELLREAIAQLLEKEGKAQ